MSNYTAEQRAELLARARETLARASQIAPLDVETLARQHKHASAPAPAPPTDKRLTDRESHLLRIELAHTIANAIATEHAYLLEQILPGYLSELISDLRKEIASTVDKLREEITTQRAIDQDLVIKRRRARKGSTVIDLPNPLMRRNS